MTSIEFLFISSMLSILFFESFSLVNSKSQDSFSNAITLKPNLEIKKASKQNPAVRS